MFEDINNRRAMVAENIQKAFHCNEIEKARSGIYADNAQNRKLGRVGLQYGSKKQLEQKNVDADKMTRGENKREEIGKRITDNALSLINGIKNRGEAEASWLTTKSGINALRKVRKSALDFAKKNPNVEFTSEMCEALAGLPLDEFIDEYGKFKGLEEYNTAIEDYLSTIDEYEMSEEEEAEEEAFDKEMKKRISSAKSEIVSALIADQGQLRPDADKVIKKLKLAAVNFVKKNPDLKVKSSMWDEIVSGENPNKYRHYDGFKQLDEAIDKYIG